MIEMLKLSNDFVIRNVFGKTVLMPVCKNDFTNNPVLLNNTASVILKLSGSCNTTEELHEQCCSFFSIPEQSEDGVCILNFIHQLKEYGLLLEMKEESQDV